MADLRYTVDVDTRGAQTALNGLKSTILNVGSAFAIGFGAKELVTIAARFEDLRTTLRFLYRDIEGGGDQAFEAIKQFATQSVFSVEDLTESVIKLKAAGINPTLERLRLFADVSSIATDSVGALQAITDLFARTTAGGLGLEDLNRLADRGIPVFDILQQKLGITRLEVSKLGQTTEGAQLILRALEEGLSETFSGASAERANNLSQSFSNLQDAIANTADAIGQAGLNEAISEAVRRFTEFLEKNRAVILVISEGFINALVFLGENLKYIAALMVGVFSAAVAGRIAAIVAQVVLFTKAIQSASIAGAILQGVTGVGLVKLAAGLAGTAAAIATINELSGDAQTSIDEVDARLNEFRNNAETPLELPSAPTADNVPNTDTPLRGDLEAIRAAQNAAISYFDEYRDGVNDIRRAVDEEAELAKMTERQANIQRELNTFSQRYYDTIRPLQREVTELRMKDTDESRVQADEIERQIGLITELYNTSITGLEEQLRLREENRREEEALILLLDNRRKLEEDFSDLVRESQQELQDLNLTPFQRELAEINRTIDNTLVASIRNLKNAWEDGLITSDEYIAEIERLKTKAAETEAILVDNARAAREIQRSFAYGWKQSFDSYVEEATNAAKAAERIFEKTTKGMEDLIVGFVKTGKLEWRSFVADILETLLRSQIQQVLAQTFSIPLNGGRSGGNFLGDLFAGFFANGGLIPAGQFGVVGENGPELISGPASVTPMSGVTNVVYNIQAVDAPSFKALIARDPEFIHAVAMQGGRAVPTRR